MGFSEQERELATLYPGIRWSLFNDMGYDDCPVLRAKFPSDTTHHYYFRNHWGDVQSNVVGGVARSLVKAFLEGDIR